MHFRLHTLLLSVGLCLAPQIALAGDAMDEAEDALKDAIEEAEDAKRGCRKAVLRGLEDAKDDLRDLSKEFSNKKAKRLKREMADLAEEADDECSKRVRRAVEEAAEAVEEALVPAEPKAPGMTTTCKDLIALVRLANLVSANPGMVKTIGRQEKFYCRPGQSGSAGAWSWPNGKPAHFGSGEWRYPNGKVARYASGEWRYPNGKVARYASGEWRYPNGRVARYGNGQWRDPRGSNATPNSLLANGCSRTNEQTCDDWRSFLEQNTGFYYNLAVVEMGWDLDPNAKQAVAKRQQQIPVPNKLTGPYFKVVSVNSNKCLHVRGSKKKNGTGLSQHSCNGEDNQSWKLEPVDKVFFKLVSKSSAKCVDVKKNSRSDGAETRIWECHGNPNQLWRLGVADGGQYELINRNSELCLDVKGRSKKKGADIQQYTCKGMANQHWRFER